MTKIAILDDYIGDLSGIRRLEQCCPTMPRSPSTARRSRRTASSMSCLSTRSSSSLSRGHAFPRGPRGSPEPRADCVQRADEQRCRPRGSDRARDPALRHRRNRAGVPQCALSITRRPTACRHRRRWRGHSSSPWPSGRASRIGTSGPEAGRLGSPFRSPAKHSAFSAPGTSAAPWSRSRRHSVWTSSRGVRI